MTEVDSVELDRDFDIDGEPGEEDFLRIPGGSPTRPRNSRLMDFGDEMSSADIDLGYGGLYSNLDDADLPRPVDVNRIASVGPSIGTQSIRPN